MNTPKKCPKCGAINLRFIDQNTSQYRCGSVVRQGTTVIQTAICTTNERDQLAERLKRLEEAGRELARRHMLVVVTYPQAQADVAAYEKAIQ